MSKIFIIVSMLITPVLHVKNALVDIIYHQVVEENVVKNLIIGI